MKTKSVEAFTLIELLVVISIIALLIGILLPALGAARKSAQAVKCATQMRQFTQANHMYANDNDGYSVPCMPNGNVNTDFWAHLIYPYIGMGELSQGADEIEMIDGQDSVFICPSTINGYKFVNDAEQDFYAENPFLRYCYSYNIRATINSYVRMGTDPGTMGLWTYATKNGAKIDAIINPTKTAFLLEGCSFYMISTWYWRDTPYPFGLIPHSGSANAPFYDGHVESITPKTDVPLNETADEIWGGNTEPVFKN